MKQDDDRIGVSARLTPEEIQRVDEVALVLTKRAKGAKVSRGGVVKIALEHGLEKLERELKIDASK